MIMKIYNTLTKKLDTFKPIIGKDVRIYSCGPTVYDHIHIGNLRAFVIADILRRTFSLSGYKPQHVMNFTDVDDKTIRRSQERYVDFSPEEALSKLTKEYETIFLSDMEAIGNDVAAINFIRATENIEAMTDLIKELYTDGVAYIADDGVYFSIEKYRSKGKTYGQLVELSESNTSSERINNDEYDKDSLHDFALWKTRKGNEPAWDFKLDGHDLLGRPGWHIECSAMSFKELGQPFDIHTGGVDLMFPHHENELAQSTATKQDSAYANYFVHNEHLLVDNRKMSKSLKNFYTLRDIQERGYEPMTFRLLMLQAHYRNQTNFTWESLQAAKNRLQTLRTIANLRWQTNTDAPSVGFDEKEWTKLLKVKLADDLDTPNALALISKFQDLFSSFVLPESDKQAFIKWLKVIDESLGLDLSAQPDISDEEKALIMKRVEVRQSKDWKESDALREQLLLRGIKINDTPFGPIWERV